MDVAWLIDCNAYGLGGAVEVVGAARRILKAEVSGDFCRLIQRAVHAAHCLVALKCKVVSVVGRTASCQKVVLGCAWIV